MNKIVDEIKSKNNDKKRVADSIEEYKKLIEEERSRKNENDNSDKIMLVIQELEKERNKPPVIEVRERKIVVEKLTSKCTDCKQEKYDSMLKKLHIVTYGALAYSVIITIITLINNKLVQSDFQTFFGQLIALVWQGIQNVNNLFLSVAIRIDNQIVQWVIHIGLWALVAGAIAFGIYQLYQKLEFKTWKFWNLGAVAILLLDLVVIAFLSEPIKNMTNLNLFAFAFLFYAVYIVIRIVLYLKKR